MKSTKVREAQRAGKLTILFDSGIRTGSDIIKALALGAQAVLRTLTSLLRLSIDLMSSQVGRPWLYGLVAGGQAGVEQVLQQTMADLDTSLGCIGYKSLAGIQGKGEEVLVKLNL